VDQRGRNNVPFSTQILTEEVLSYRQLKVPDSDFHERGQRQEQVSLETESALSLLETNCNRTGEITFRRESP